MRRVLHPPAVTVVALLAVAALVGAGCSSDSTPEAAPTTTAPTTTVVRYAEPVTDDVVVTRDVAYGSAPGVDGATETLLLDIYDPAVDDDAARRPAIVFVHGGGFAAGDKQAGPSADMARHFAELGYLTVSINYRLLAPLGCGGGDAADDTCVTAATEAIHDAQAAVRWLRANADDRRVDPERIAIGGESAGAITSVGVGVLADSPGASGNPGHPSHVAAWMSISGGVPGGIFVDEGDAPGLLFAGTADPIVPHSWSVETRDALQAAGVAVQLVSYDGLGHVPWGERRDDIIERTTDFFYEHLRLDEVEEHTG